MTEGIGSIQIIQICGEAAQTLLKSFLAGRRPICISTTRSLGAPAVPVTVIFTFLCHPFLYCSLMFYMSPYRITIMPYILLRYSHLISRHMLMDHAYLDDSSFLRDTFSMLCNTGYVV